MGPKMLKREQANKYEACYGDFHICLAKVVRNFRSKYLVKEQRVTEKYNPKLLIIKIQVIAYTIHY